MRLYEITGSEIINFIKKNCQPYLKQNPESDVIPLFRGITLPYKEYHILDANKHREPVDTSFAFHNGIDRAMKDSGYKATRSNSIFCTGDLRTASKYGSLHVIYPIGDFDFTWSLEVDDLILEVHKFYHNLPTEYFEQILPFFKDEIDSFEKNFKDLFDGISNESAFKAYRNFLSGITKFRESVPQEYYEKFLKDKRYRTNDLRKAILSKHEIMITCDKYVAIPVENFQDIRGQL